MISTLILAFASLASAHTAAFAPGMYCRGGNTSVDDSNTNLVVNPLYDLPKSEWWFQHDRGCDLMPPKSGEFLELPAGKSVTVELAHNRGQTTLSYDGKYTSDWPDGLDHPEDYHGVPAPGSEEGCLSDGSLHATNHSNAAGTAFAISYQSDLSKVTLENLVVFTVLEHTPWKRIATYDVPAGLPACPPEGCTCAWLWVPHLCGTSNMYMQGFKCKVTGAASTLPLAKAQVPVMCKDDPSKCVKGAKQMLAWNQRDGNNIFTEFPISPGYNTDCGWKSGAQNDIFVPAPVSSSTSLTSSIIKPTTAPPAPTTLKTSTKSTTTTTTTTTKAAAPTPTGPASGTIYLTTGQNWDGSAENWSWNNGDCKKLTSLFKSNVGSAGPNAGTCTFFDDAYCTGTALLTMNYPGKSNLGSTGKKFKSFWCK